MRLVHLALVGSFMLPLALAACSTAGATGPRRSMDLISIEELTEGSYRSAFEAIQRLRPQWLRGRGTVSIRGGENLPVVFLNQARYGGIEQLQNIALQDIDSIRFVNSRDATTRHGTGYPGGIIEVRTRNR